MNPKKDGETKPLDNTDPAQTSADGTAALAALVTPPANYRVVERDFKEHAALILKLWQAGLGHNGLPAGKLDWYYQKHIEGAPAVLLLEHEGTPGYVGVAAIGTRIFRIGDQTVSCGEMVDFVVLPEHRTLSPAIMLMRAVHERGLQQHVAIYGLPNPKSLAVVKRAGYKRVGDMVRFARVLRSSVYLSQYVPPWISAIIGPVIDQCRQAQLRLSNHSAQFSSAWVTQPDERFDDLWNRIKMPDVILGKRDAAFLNWRFIVCPLQAQRFFILTARDTGQLIGYAVCETIKQALHVHDFLADPAVPDAFQSLWRQLANEAFRLGCSSLSTEFLGHAQTRAALHQAGLLVRSTRTMCGVTRDDYAYMFDADRWYITCADEDG